MAHIGEEGQGESKKRKGKEQQVVGIGSVDVFAVDPDGRTMERGNERVWSRRTMLFQTGFQPGE